jgi:hypothetical protein
MPTQLRNSLALAAALCIAGTASAGPITTSFTSFGPLAGATFGGTGIPNNAVAITTTTDLTLGLTAHQRFFAAPVTNNGAGVFYALPGLSQNAPSPADPYATWNFGFYVGGTGTSAYSFRLFYDFDPAQGTDESAHGSTFSPVGSVTSLSQGSWNLGMDFLETPPQNLGITAPAFPTFNPNAEGQYSFALVAYNANGVEAARSAIVVQVPEPGSLALAGLALFGLAAARRRTKA